MKKKKGILRKLLTNSLMLCYNIKKRDLWGETNNMKKLKAIDVARYIVWRASENGTPISHLQLQKILYIVFGKVYKTLKRELFEEEFYAWVYGPVVLEVYDEYCIYSAATITPLRPPNVSIEDATLKAVIDSEIDIRSKQPAFQLVDETHRKDGAWRSVYGNGEGRRKKISRERIFTEFNNKM